MRFVQLHKPALAKGTYDTATVGFPVVYHLHGVGGNQNTSVPAAFDEARQMGLVSERYIVVFPNGLANSMWAELFNTRSSPVSPQN
jgi:enterochelin esterase-like enzyme